MPIVKERKEAARILEVDVRSLANWKKEPGFPAMDDGYDTDAISAWRSLRSDSRAKTQVDDQQDMRDLRREKIRGLKIKNDEAELVIARKRGLLYPRELFTEAMGIYAGAVRQSIVIMRKKGHVLAAQILEEQLKRSEKAVTDLVARAITKSGQ